MKSHTNTFVTSAGGAPQTISAAYAYDAAGQVTGVDFTGGPFADANYAFDVNGNRQSVNTGGVTRNYATDQNNRLNSDGQWTYTYDDEGNRISKTKIDNTQKFVYSWDAKNRLTKVEVQSGSGYPGGGTYFITTATIQYEYDAFDRKILRRESTQTSGQPKVERYVYDGYDLVMVFDGANQITERVLHGPAIDMVLADEKIGGGYPGYPGYGGSLSVSFPLTDMLGTVRDLVDTSGNPTGHIDYDAFGGRTANGADTGTTTAARDFLFSYTGRIYDKATGLYDYRARWYDPAAGRFISEDPIGFAGGDANLSRYVGNAAINRVDPEGTDGRDAIITLPSTNWRDQAINEYIRRRSGNRVLTHEQFMRYYQQYLDREVRLNRPFLEGLCMPGGGLDQALMVMSSFTAAGAASSGRIRTPSEPPIPSRPTRTRTPIRSRTGAFLEDESSYRIPQFDRNRTRTTGSLGELVDPNSGASNVNAGAALNKKLSALEDAQKTAASTRILPDGRIRYYEAEKLARTPGPTRGASFVTECDPITGTVRQWMESYDHAGNVVRVHPKTLNGQDLISPHFPPTGKELGQ